jgi:FkbM family methyltransferase
VLSYPWRRRLCLRNELRFTNGKVFRGPAGEHVVPLLLEVWGDEIYRGPLCLERDGDGCIVDIGSNLGAFSIWAVQQFPGRRVVAVEPDPELYSFFRSNLAEFGADRVELVEAACGAAVGSAVLHRRGEHSWNTLCTSDKYGSTFRDGPVVRVTTLEDLFLTNKIHKCHLLKLDCEGAEYDVLMNAPPAILSMVENVAMEYHIGLNSSTPAELSAFLANSGFFVQLQPPIDAEGGYLYASRVPLRPSK